MAGAEYSVLPRSEVQSGRARLDKALRERAGSVHDYGTWRVPRRVLSLRRDHEADLQASSASPRIMFDAKIRDKLLFEDDNYTMARRYFWAHQTLGIMNESIKALVEAYDDRFTDDVWEGRHKTLWPLLDDTSNRNKHYRKKMAGLREEFNIMLGRLRKLIEENNDRRREIQDLREDLFTGTSIQESRKSVNATETTVQQGYNIKLLTMVSADGNTPTFSKLR